MKVFLAVYEKKERNGSLWGQRTVVFPSGHFKSDAHKTMAANIEQIFQDFILKKIREIEDQSGDPAYVSVDSVLSRFDL